MLTNDTGHRLCKARELSTSGALLDIGWSALTHGTPVHVIVDLPDGEGIRSFNLPGIVARVSADGTAIRFVGLDAETQLALSRALMAL